MATAEGKHSGQTILSTPAATQGVQIQFAELKKGTERNSMDDTEVNEEFLAQIVSKITYENGASASHRSVRRCHYKQAFQAFYTHVIALLLGSPLCGIILVPLLGYRTCIERAFILLPRKSSIGSRAVHMILAHSYGIPVCVYITLYKLYIGTARPLSSWGDVFLVFFPVLMYLWFVTLKYAMTEPEHFRVLYGKSKGKMVGSFAPMLARSGLLGGTEMALEVYLSEFMKTTDIVQGLLGDYFCMPVAVVASSPKKGGDVHIIHNEETFYTARESHSKIEESSVRHVKSVTLGRAILRSFASHLRSKQPLNRIHQVADVVSGVYILGRIIMAAGDGSISTSWVEWVNFLLLMTIKVFALRQWYHHSGMALALFQKMKFLETRLGKIIHQLHIACAEDVQSWSRLRFAMHMMDSKSLYYCVVYSGASLLGSGVFIICVTGVTYFAPEDPIIIGHFSLVLLHVFVVQGLTLYAIKIGAKTNWYASRHVDEWLKEKSSIGIRMNALNVQLHCQKGGKQPGKILADIARLDGAMTEIDILCKRLKNEIDFGGLRFFSMRITKVLFKTLMLLFLYQVLYLTVWIIRKSEIKISDAFLVAL